MLEMINLVFPISASMASSSSWGLYNNIIINNNICLKSNIQTSSVDVQWTFSGRSVDCAPSDC